MPQQYTLNLTINATDLTTIAAAGENIIVAKLVGNPSDSPSVAWLSIPPAQNTQVQWTEQYAIYASSQTPIQSGAVIFPSSTTPYPASDGVCYELVNQVFSASPAYGYLPVPSGSYSALNKMTSSAAMTFGLTQAAIVSGTNVQPGPVNAELIPSNQQTVFTPSLTVWVWLQSSITSGTVVVGLFKPSLVEVVSPPAAVSFPGGVTTQNLQYSSSQGGFVSA